MGGSNPALLRTVQLNRRKDTREMYRSSAMARLLIQCHGQAQTVYEPANPEVAGLSRY